MVHKIRQVIEYGQTTAINQNSILEVPVASITAVTMDDSPRLMDITYEFKASVIVKVIELAGRPLPFQETRTLSISVQGIPEIPGNSVDTFLRNLKDNETPWDDVLGAADRIIQHLHFLGQLPGLSTAVSIFHGGPEVNTRNPNF